MRKIVILTVWLGMFVLIILAEGVSDTFYALLVVGGGIGLNELSKGGDAKT